METIKDLLNLKFERDTSVAIGNFDGVHLGHQELIKKFATVSQSKNLESILVTFKPHPGVFFNEKIEDFLIQSYDEKKELINELGVDQIFECWFTEELSRLTASEFIENYLLKIPNLKFIFLGHDFKLGHGKENAVEILKSAIKNQSIDLMEFDSYKKNEMIVSSTLIRDMIKKDITIANEYLGRPFALTGKVISGLGIGKKELFATINIEPEKVFVKPSQGVYAGYVKINNQQYDAVINIGTNPTIGHNDKVKYEAHILHSTDIIPAKRVEFLFLKKLREEKKFPTKADLRSQISRDIDNALSFLREKSQIRLALIGKDIQHSRSRDMYEKILKCSVNYTLIDCASEDTIPSLSSLQEKYLGVSITAPYKKSYIPLAKKLEPDLESVNTIIFSDPILLGNTDYLAVHDILKSYIGDNISNFIVLGDGNMGQMTVQILKSLGFVADVYSRKSKGFENLYEKLDSLGKNYLIINTCSRSFIFQPKNSGKYCFWDMNYARPEQDKILHDLSITYKDGLEMLSLQAKYALKLWKIID